MEFPEPFEFIGDVLWKVFAYLHVCIAMSSFKHYSRSMFNFHRNGSDLHSQHDHYFLDFFFIFSVSDKTIYKPSDFDFTLKSLQVVSESPLIV